MKTVNIKGKEYVLVNDRLKYFRENFKGYSLISELVAHANGEAIFKASIINDAGVTVATGYACETKENGSFINETSHIENCETSAWGRALANFGIGIDASVASADEVANAIKQQKEPAKQNKITVEQQKQLLDADVKNVLSELLIAKKLNSVAEIPAEKFEATMKYVLDRQ